MAVHDFTIEPSRRCPRHDENPAGHACGPCADQAEFHREWTLAKRVHDADEVSTLAKERARLMRADIDMCLVCDDKGMLADRSLCRHDDGRQAAINRRGFARVKEALAASRTGVSA